MMKLRYMSLLICLALISFGQKDSFGQQTYHGGNKHVQPDLAVFPSANYHPDILITGDLKNRLDKTVNDLFNLTGMPGISVAMLVCDRIKVVERFCRKKQVRVIKIGARVIARFCFTVLCGSRLGCCPYAF